jgi:hypothetical protein
VVLGAGVALLRPPPVYVSGARSGPVVGGDNKGATETTVAGPPGGEVPTLPPGMDPQPGDTVVFPPAWATGRSPVLIPAGEPNPGPLVLWRPSPTP